MKVILWQNGMVMVFDRHGQQVPDLQGPIEEVRDAIAKSLRLRGDDVVWQLASWGGGQPRVVTREQWLRVRA